MKQKILGVLIFILGICLLCAFMYGCYWLAKHISWSLFYEDLVRDKILEMVKTGSLK